MEQFFSFDSRFFFPDEIDRTLIRKKHKISRDITRETVSEITKIRFK